MTEPEKRKLHLDDERLDSLIESFFECELPAERLRHREVATIDTNRVAASSTRRFLVLVVTALSLLVMANVFWQPRIAENPPEQEVALTDKKGENGPARVSPTLFSRPLVTRIPRSQKNEKVILPEGQEFGMNFSQVDERREHVDPKTGTRFNLTTEQYEIELFPIPGKETESKPKTRTKKPATGTKTKKNTNPKKKSRPANRA